MKKILLITLFLSVGLSQNQVNINNLLEMGGKMFKENERKPFDGIVFDLSKETGNIILEYRMVNGLKNGLYQEWSSDGILIKKGKYLNGIKIGLYQEWYANGNSQSKGKYLNGIKIGLWTEWVGNTNQQKKEINYKDNNIRIETVYYRNGKKKSEVIYKGNDKDGIWTYWSENGDRFIQEHIIMIISGSVHGQLDPCG